MSAAVSRFILLFLFVRSLPYYPLVERNLLSPFKFSLAILAIMLMRNFFPLKKVDPLHTLFLLSIREGDLFLTKRNQHGRFPVIGFFEHIKGVKTIQSYGSTTAYFTSIEEGTVGIYFRKNSDNRKNHHWSKFHEVWIGGRSCIIHEDFIGPLPKSKGESNEQKA
tara:strand:+ start:1533 stop:2027 length:495 start_codon:yes stop_codon:yes gene_type:complete